LKIFSTGKRGYFNVKNFGIKRFYVKTLWRVSTHGRCTGADER
jgi:hypothetical protein